MIGVSGAGRNNISGESYLYVASNPQTACMEIKPQFSDLESNEWYGAAEQRGNG